MKHRRARKPDRLTNPEHIGVTSIMAKHRSLEPVDKIAAEMEMKWGVDRLPSLVSPDMAAKFGSAEAKLDKAIDDDDQEAVTKRANVMWRAWIALDKEAERLGAKPIDISKIVFWRSDAGQPYAIFKDNAEALAFAKSGKGEGIRYYTLAEISRLIEKWEDQAPFAREAKKEFGGAEIMSVTPTAREMDEEMPF